MHIVHPSLGDIGHKQHVVVPCMHFLLPHARFMHACVHGSWGRHAVIVIETVNHPLKIVIVIENEIENENEIVTVVTLAATRVLCNGSGAAAASYITACMPPQCHSSSCSIGALRATAAACHGTS